MSNGDAGFTLTEVLVALAISAMLTAFAYRGLVIGTRGARVSTVEASMLEVAKDELQKAGVETPLSEGTQNGRTGHVDWTLVVTPYRAPSDGLAAALGKPRAYWLEIETCAEGRPPRRLTTLKMVSGSDAR